MSDKILNITIGASVYIFMIGFIGVGLYGLYSRKDAILIALGL